MFLKLTISAQPGNGNGNGPPKGPPGNGNGKGPGCWPPPCIPIDNGIEYLILAGVIYGGRKAWVIQKALD